MHCLSCGDCCKRMSPISNPYPCPHLLEEDDICLCSIYEDRPEECKNHRFPSSKCPVGIGVLNIKTHEEFISRMDKVWEVIKSKWANQKY